MLDGDGYVDVCAEAEFEMDAATRQQIADLCQGYVADRDKIYQRPVPLTIQQINDLVVTFHEHPPALLVLPWWFPVEHREWAETWAREHGWAGVVYGAPPLPDMRSILQVIGRSGI